LKRYFVEIVKVTYLYRTQLFVLIPNHGGAFGVVGEKELKRLLNQGGDEQRRELTSFESH
jgi:hypothetical protein